MRCISQSTAAHACCLRQHYSSPAVPQAGRQCSSALSQATTCQHHRLRQRRCCCVHATSSHRPSSELDEYAEIQKSNKQGAAPWSMVFDLRERETEWSDANQVCLPSAHMPSAHMPSAHMPSAHMPSAHMPSAHMPFAHMPSAHMQVRQLRMCYCGNCA
jgi:hypothetical protein